LNLPWSEFALGPGLSFWGRDWILFLGFFFD
jgi:hypothetical protein